MDYQDTFIMGIAGNTPGHLSQVGETDDFEKIETSGENDPKCIFPIYSPNVDDEITSTLPISSEKINLPDLGPVQLEPEVAIVFDVEYQNGKIADISPKAAYAFNDCSIRIPDGEEKISRRKNWGENSKGIASSFIPLESLKEGDTLDRFRLCAFLERNGELSEYAVDSGITDYTFFNEKLLQWIIDTLNTQEEFRNIDNMLNLIEKSNYPNQFIISIGAIEYTDFGEKTFLKNGDKGFIVLYDGSLYNQEFIYNELKAGNSMAYPGVSALSFLTHLIKSNGKKPLIKIRD